jgi:hypothetical protein
MSENKKATTIKKQELHLKNLAQTLKKNLQRRKHSKKVFELYEDKIKKN